MRSASSSRGARKQQAADLLSLLWYWGTFPLSFVTYSAIVAFVLGMVVGHYL